MKQVIFSAILSVAVLLTPSAAVAEEIGPYIGAGIAHVTVRDYCEGIAGSCEESEIGFKIFGGVRPSENFGLEAGYIRAEGFDVNVQSQGTTLPVDSVIQTFYLAGVGAFPIGEVFAVTGKAGFHFWDQEISVPVSGSAVNVAVNVDGTEPMFGIGAEFRPDDNVILQAEWIRLLGEDVDIDTLSGSLAWTF